MSVRVKTWYQPRGSALRHAVSRPDAARPSIQPRGAGHKANLLTLLSAGDASTRDLALVLELSGPYVGTLLGDLELEGRIEKVGRGVWRLA
jgi:hypothetical protein